MKDDFNAKVHGISSKHWEGAFLTCAPDGRNAIVPDSDDVIRHVLSDVHEDGRATLERLLDQMSADAIVEEVLEAFKIGNVGVYFPFSTHGDAISISISRFPGGTAVGRGWDTVDGDSGIRFIIAIASLPEVISEARSALLELQDAADWILIEEDEEVPDEGEGNAACLVGFRELGNRWPKLRVSKKPSDT